MYKSSIFASTHCVSDVLKFHQPGLLKKEVNPVPFSSSRMDINPLLPSSSIFFPFLWRPRFLPFQPRCVDHGPEEIQAHGTSSSKV